MRKINWDEKLSKDDIAWLRQAGIVGVEDRIARNAEEHGSEVPDVEVPDDPATRSADDPSAASQRVVNDQGGAQEVDPRDADPQDEADDDYDQWTRKELEDEVSARNAIAADREEVSEVSVEGTGTNGSVVKTDLIKGLRLWDQDNPGVLTD